MANKLIGVNVSGNLRLELMRKLSFGFCRKVQAYRSGSRLWSLIFALTFFALASTALAQPTMSRGEQLLSLSYDECMRRAERAFNSEGWVNIGKGNASVNAFKEEHGAYIMCNVAPDNKVWVNMVVASLSQNAGIPGGERVKLQGRMGESSSSAGCKTPKIFGTYNTSGDPVGVLVIDRQDGNRVVVRYGKDENSLVNRMEGNFQCNILSGTFTNTVYNATGTFKYTFSDDGFSFSGQWWNDGGGTGSTSGVKK